MSETELKIFTVFTEECYMKQLFFNIKVIFTKLFELRAK